MKYPQSAILAVAASAMLSAGAYAATMQGGSASSRMQPWLGTWACRAAGASHTATFTPVFGGRGMRISETNTPASEEIIIFDSKRNRWIDQYADASGAYFTLEGPQRGNTIRFSQVYPAGNAAILVRMTSKNVYTTTYTATLNGKKISIPAPVIT